MIKKIVMNDNGQVTIPSTFRDALNWKEGEKYNIFLMKNGCYVTSCDDVPSLIHLSNRINEIQDMILQLHDRVENLCEAQIRHESSERENIIKEFTIKQTSADRIVKTIPENDNSKN